MKKYPTHFALVGNYWCISTAADIPQKAIISKLGQSPLVYCFMPNSKIMIIIF